MGLTIKSGPCLDHSISIEYWLDNGESLADILGIRDDDHHDPGEPDRHGFLCAILSFHEDGDRPVIDKLALDEFTDSRQLVPFLRRQERRAQTLMCSMYMDESVQAKLVELGTNYP